MTQQLSLFARSYTAVAEELLKEAAPASNGNGHHAAELAPEEPENVNAIELEPAEPGPVNERTGQVALFDKGEWWHEHWKGMPEFVQEDLAPVKTIYIHFETREDYQAFAKLVGQTLTMNTRSIWYPEAEIGRTFNKRYIDAPEPEPVNEDIEVLE
jgi:hypothetical protein